MNSHRVICVTATEVQAHALKNLLAEHGIVALVSHADVVGSTAVPGHSDASPRIVVPQSDVPEARRIVEEATAALEQGQASPELIQLEDEVGPDAPWPACPHCSRPRLTSCPVCETAGHHFPAAFLPDYAWHTGSESEADEREPLLVLCTTCDEPFAPQFPARCEWCGHRFADGYEPPGSDLLSAPLAPPAEPNLRVVAVVIGLAVLAGLALGWFYLVANHSGG